MHFTSKTSSRLSVSIAYAVLIGSSGSLSSVLKVVFLLSLSELLLRPQLFVYTFNIVKGNIHTEVPLQYFDLVPTYHWTASGTLRIFDCGVLHSHIDQ